MNEYGDYQWRRTGASITYSIYCQYGGIEGVSNPMTRRVCDEYGNWEEVQYNECLTYATSLLKNITVSKLHAKWLL